MNYPKTLITATKPETITDQIKLDAGNGSYLIYKGDTEYNGIWIEFQPKGSPYSTPIAYIENPTDPKLESPATETDKITIYLYENPFDDEYTEKRTINTEKIRQALGIKSKTKNTPGYTPPTTEGIGYAILDGYTADAAIRGYTVMELFIGKFSIQKIERIDVAYNDIKRLNLNPPDDEDCARHAKKTGFAKIIPVEELPDGFEYKEFYWIDTPENREKIRQAVKVM